MVGILFLFRITSENIFSHANWKESCYIKITNAYHY